MIEDVFAAVPIGFLLSIMIGPVFFVLLETSITKGFRAAIVFNLGVILGDIAFILTAFFSSFRLIQSIKDEPALFILGGVLMLIYGIISYLKLKSKIRNNVQEITFDIIKKDYLSLFIKGFLLNFINIGVLGFWLALLITVGPQLDMETSRIITFFGTVLISYFTIDIGKILIAQKLRSYLNSSNILKIKQWISIILMISGIVLLIQGWFSSDNQILQNSFKTMEHHPINK